MAKKEQTIKLMEINPKTVTVTIVGDSDLVLNKMNAKNEYKLIHKDETILPNDPRWNEWNDVITSMHWINGTPTEFSEDSLKENLDPRVNAPCITAFGLKKSFGEAVTRNKISTYSTEFKATVNVIGEKGNLIPIRFAEYHLDEKVMSPQGKGSAMGVKLNRFSGWGATFKVSYLENVYSLEQIINIINLAGFGLGIGSGRSSDYGRYHIENIQ